MVKCLRRYQEWVSQAVEKAEEEVFKNAAKPVGNEGFLTQLICLSGRQMPQHQGKSSKRG
ncbi:MAG: hypothetical protein ABIF11_05090 [Nitrospirota bacterium]